MAASSMMAQVSPTVCTARGQLQVDPIVCSADAPQAGNDFGALLRGEVQNRAPDAEVSQGDDPAGETEPGSDAETRARGVSEVAADSDAGAVSVDEADVATPSPVPELDSMETEPALITPVSVAGVADDPQTPEDAELATPQLALPVSPVLLAAAMEASDARALAQPTEASRGLTAAQVQAQAAGDSPATEKLPGPPIPPTVVATPGLTGVMPAPGAMNNLPVDPAAEAAMPNLPGQAVIGAERTVIPASANGSTANRLPPEGIPLMPGTPVAEALAGEIANLGRDVAAALSAGGEQPRMEGLLNAQAVGPAAGLDGASGISAAASRIDALSGLSPSQASATPATAHSALSAMIDTQKSGWAPVLANELLQIRDMGDSRLRINLAPAHLGAIDCELVDTARGIELRVVTDSDAARQLMQDNSQDLRERFAESGLTLADFHCETGEESSSAEADEQQRVNVGSATAEGDENLAQTRVIDAGALRLLDLYA